MIEKNETNCPKCNSEDIYFDGNLWICPSCNYEWVAADHLNENLITEEINSNVICDAFGNVLTSGDSVTVVKELKIKGSSSVVKVGTKVKNIRLTEGDDGHNIACKIDGIGSINLKSEFVKKA